nr:HK97 family phage prohead protease [Bradyrhizobium manausense]
MSDLSVDDQGRVDGYGAFFGNVDSHGDSIDRGAFQKTLADWHRKGRLPPMLLQHANGPLLEDAFPIGAWDHMEEDERGLKVRGRLAIGNRRADDVAALLRMNPPAFNGASIGYVSRRFTLMPKGSEVRRRLHEIDLKELSLVSEPSNDLARVRYAKSKRDDDGFSRALAQLAAAVRG